MSNKNLGKLSAECVLKGKLNFPIAEEGIDTSDANAMAEDILKDRTAYVKGKKVVGSIPEYGRTVIEPSRVKTSLEAGYYNGVEMNAVTAAIDPNIIPQNIKKGITILNVTGSASTGVDTSDATAISENIEKGQTAYVNEEKITGTLPITDNYNPNAFDVTINSSNNYIDFSTINWSKKIINSGAEIKLSKTYNDIANKIELTADKILNGETILGIAGSATSDGNITADDLISGKIAYSKGEKITGNILNTNNINIPYMRSNGGADDFEFVVNISGTISGDDKYCIDNTTNINIAISYDKLAQIIGLTADKLKIGETVLGITGE